ncbi:MAG: hypothetical protein EXR12_09035 [Rhodospirillaceae bacterium]|nr:hypothetical protein [Rhodospirillaceae bacterium]
MISASRELEILVAKIQKQLAPNAEVLHDVKLRGRHTQRMRQIDVLIREKIGQFDMQIAVECKDTQRPTDVKGVETFAGLLDDVGAQKGVLVCPLGFTETAKVRAAGYQIDLYSPIDTDAHKWQATVTIAAMCDYRRAVMKFRIGMRWPIPLIPVPNFYSTFQIYDDADNALGTPLEIASKNWHSGLYPTDPGRHEQLSIFSTDKTLIDDSKGASRLRRAPVDLTVSLIVMKQLYYGQLSVPHISGFVDRLSGKVITDAFTVGLISPDEVENTWLKINDESEAPKRPVIVLPGLVNSTNEDVAKAR